jgi:WD40 repeat protein
VRLWDVATGKSLPTLEGHPTDVHAIAFSRDGKQLASASYDGTVKVWDAAALQALEDDTAEDRTAGIDAITFSPDGKQLALGLEDMTVQIWDAATCDTLHVLDPHLNWINAVAFSPDGKQLASASYHTVRLLDVATGATLQTLEGYTNTIHAIAFSPDGAIIINPSVPTNIPDQSNPTIDIFVKDQWIVRRGDNFLWLPIEYRLIPKAIHKTTIAMGCTLKQALILEFKI